MFLKLFNTNRPIVLFLLVLIGICLWLTSFLTAYIEVPNPSFIYLFLNEINTITGNIIAFATILISGIMISSFVNKSIYFNKINYLPAFFYVLLMSSMKEFSCHNPIIYANLFLILGFGRLHLIYQQEKCKSHVFISSAYMFIATMFFLPYIVFLILIWIVLFLIRPLVFKEWIMPFISFIVIGFNSFVIYRLFFENILFNYNFINTSIIITNSDSDFYIYIISIIAIFSIISIIALSKKYIQSVNRFKKLSLSVIYFLLISISLSAYFYFTNLNNASILIMAVPLSIILAFILYIRTKKWIYETLIFTLFVLIIVNKLLL